MPKIIAVTGQKGGSGKTTTAVCVADEYHRRGHRVLVVDLDPQATALTTFSVGLENEIDGPTGIGMKAGFHKTLSGVAEGYDRVVIDCPPGQSPDISGLQRAALMVADIAILPCGPGVNDIWSLGETIELVQAAQDFRPELSATILITRKDARTTLSAQTREVLETSGLPVLKTTLGYRVAYQEYPAAGMGVTRYQPGGTAAREVKDLVNELDKIGTKEFKEVV